MRIASCPTKRPVEKEPIMINARGGLLALVLCAVMATGCTRLQVASEPAGAQVLWSASPKGPWQPWPPKPWTGRASASGEALTPLKASGVFGDLVYVTVEKEGYLRPLPRPAELYFGHRESLAFHLVELPEKREARLLAEGLVRYKGEWVDPKAKGLSQVDGEWLPEAEAIVRRNTAAGLVQHEGEWITPAARDEKVLAAKAAQGLLLHKGRWMTAEQRDAEDSVDTTATKIRESKAYPDLPTPRVASSAQRTLAQLQLSNSTGQVVRFLVSGAVSAEFTLQPYASIGARSADQILVPDGRYDVVVIPTGKDATGRNLAEIAGRLDRQQAVALDTDPQWASWPLSAGQQYSFSYSGAKGNLRENLATFEVKDPELDFTPPTIEIPEVKLPAAPESPRREGGGGPPGGEGRRGPGGGGRPRQ
jgi:hypothetical protein